VIHYQGIPFRIYYDAPDGTTWRVHDVAFEQGERVTLSVPGGGGDARVFVAADGAKRTYRFTKGEIRELTESRVQRQWELAEVVADIHSLEER
jgi:hypothetical protein